MSNFCKVFFFFTSYLASRSGTKISVFKEHIFVNKRSGSTKTVIRMPKNSQPPLTSESQHLEPGPPDIILISLPSDGGYGWIIALMAFLMNLICDGVINNFGKLLTEISQELNVPESQVAVIGSIFTGIHFFSGPFASALINRFGFRRCGIVGALIATVFMYLSSVSVNYVHLAIYHGICGIGTGILACVASICVGYHFDKYRPFALGIATSGTGAGTFAMEPFINWIIADSLENAGHWKLFMKWESVVLMTGMVMSLFAAKPKTLSMKEKVSQAGETKSWFQRIFRQSVDENESSSSQDDISIRNFTARQSAWSFQTYKSPRLSIVGAPEQPTLAEMIYVHDDELLQIKKDQEFRKNNRKFRFYPKFHKSFHAPKGIGKKIMRTLPLHRDDILYSQSATKFAERRAEELNLGLPLGCSEDTLLNNHLLLTRAPVEFLHNSKIKKFCLHLKHSLKMVFVISMFKSWTFNVLCVGSFCYAAGLFVPFMYLTGKLSNFSTKKRYII